MYPISLATAPIATQKPAPKPQSDKFKDLLKPFICMAVAASSLIGLAWVVMAMYQRLFDNSVQNIPLGHALTTGNTTPVQELVALSTGALGLRRVFHAMALGTRSQNIAPNGSVYITSQSHQNGMLHLSGFTPKAQGSSITVEDQLFMSFNGTAFQISHIKANASYGKLGIPFVQIAGNNLRYSAQDLILTSAPSDSNSRLAVMAYSPTNQLLWKKVLSVQSIASGLQLTQDGGLLIDTYTYPFANSPSVGVHSLIKLNATTGNVIWGQVQDWLRFSNPKVLSNTTLIGLSGAPIRADGSYNHLTTLWTLSPNGPLNTVLELRRLEPESTLYTVSTSLTIVNDTPMIVWNSATKGYADVLQLDLNGTRKAGYHFALNPSWRGGLPWSIHSNDDFQTSVTPTGDVLLWVEGDVSNDEDRKYDAHVGLFSFNEGRFKWAYGINASVGENHKYDTLGNHAYESKRVLLSQADTGEVAITITFSTSSSSQLLIKTFVPNGPIPCDMYPVEGFPPLTTSPLPASTVIIIDASNRYPQSPRSFAFTDIPDPAIAQSLTTVASTAQPCAPASPIPLPPPVSTLPVTPIPIPPLVPPPPYPTPPTSSQFARKIDLGNPILSALFSGAEQAPLLTLAFQNGSHSILSLDAEGNFLHHYQPQIATSYGALTSQVIATSDTTFTYLAHTMRRLYPPNTFINQVMVTKLFGQQVLWSRIIDNEGESNALLLSRNGSAVFVAGRLCLSTGCAPYVDKLDTETGASLWTRLGAFLHNNVSRYIRVVGLSETQSGHLLATSSVQLPGSTSEESISLLNGFTGAPMWKYTHTRQDLTTLGTRIFNNTILLNPNEEEDVRNPRVLTLNQNGDFLRGQQLSLNTSFMHQAQLENTQTRYCDPISEDAVFCVSKSTQNRAHVERLSLITGQSQWAHTLGDPNVQTPPARLSLDVRYNRNANTIFFAAVDNSHLFLGKITPTGGELCNASVATSLRLTTTTGMSPYSLTSSRPDLSLLIPFFYSGVRPNDTTPLPCTWTNIALAADSCLSPQRPSPSSENADKPVSIIAIIAIVSGVAVVGGVLYCCCCGKSSSTGVIAFPAEDTDKETEEAKRKQLAELRARHAALGQRRVDDERYTLENDVISREMGYIRSEALVVEHGFVGSLARRAKMEEDF